MSDSDPPGERTTRTIMDHLYEASAIGCEILRMMTVVDWSVDEKEQDEWK